MHGGFKTQTIREAYVQHGRILADHPAAAEAGSEGATEADDAIALDAQHRHLVRCYLRGIITAEQYIARAVRLVEVVR